MHLLGRILEKTNNSTEVIGQESVLFNSLQVDRWGLFTGYGSRSLILVAKIHGLTVAARKSDMTPEQRKETDKIRNRIKVDGVQLSAIRSARSAGCVWDTR